MLSLQSIQNAYKTACLDELQALKPGNVHIFADGHDMDISHFINSAEVSASALCQPDVSVGQRILASVQATQVAVAMNTNLGILLLCAPLIHAASEFINKPMPSALALRQSLQRTLKALTIEDGQLASEAIVLASPAGLGERSDLDVKSAPNATLLSLMQTAQEDDRIAKQYANDFEDLFEFGLSCLRSGLEQWERLPWATSWLYLNFMSRFSDTHIIRKYGEKMALNVAEEARVLQGVWQQKGHPKFLKKELLDWDKSLKKRRLNPGTSADLTVSTLLIHALCKSL